MDAENNGDGLTKAAATFGGGPIITRLNGNSPGDTTIYFDDRGYITISGTLIGNLNGTLCPNATPIGTDPNVGLDGVDSTEPYRWWKSGGSSNSDCTPSSGWGDAKGLNAWTFLQYQLSRKSDIYRPSYF